jgi:GNAT superfamily N-acetyltransferase
MSVPIAPCAKLRPNSSANPASSILPVDKRTRGHGLGEMLLVHALRSAQRASEVVGIYAVVVDAWDEAAKKLLSKVPLQRTSR